ncbi:hypothetical protein ND748_26425, partial [Frankia sp. AiPs1]|nr:hypothetical protein [Frankia sp. AiPs1]
VRAGLPRPTAGPPGGAATDPPGARSPAGSPAGSPAPTVRPAGAVPAGPGPAWDLDRVAAVLPALTALLGPADIAPAATTPSADTTAADTTAAGTRPDSTALARTQEEYSDA